MAHKQTAKTKQNLLAEGGPMLARLLCRMGILRHQGVLGVNPENENSEVQCRRCGTWTPARGTVMENGDVEHWG